MKKVLMTAAAVCMAASFGSAIAGDAAAGKGSYAVCSGCHGATGAGNAALGYPKLSGLKEDYVATQIRDFKSGKRNNATMKAMTASLQDADIDNVSAYIATMK